MVDGLKQLPKVVIGIGYQPTNRPADQPTNQSTSQKLTFPKQKHMGRTR